MLKKAQAAPGVRSSSEVFMHIAISKAEVESAGATVDGIYLRIIIHANEHMGQLIAYARMNGIVPPWSESAAQ